MIEKYFKIIFSKIGLKLVIPYLVVSFFTLLLIGGLLFYQYRTQLDSIGKTQEEVAVNASAKVDSYISEIIKELKLLSKNVSCLDCQEVNSLQLKNLIAIDPSIYDLSIINRDGQELNKLSRYDQEFFSKLENVAEQANFRKAIADDLYISAIYFSSYNLPLILISVPIVDESNKKIGIVSAEIDLSPLWGTISKVQVKKTGYVYVVDQDGHLIAYRDIALVKQYLELGGISGVKNFLSRVRDFSSYDSFTKEKVIGKWEVIGVTNWGLLVELPMAEIYQETVTILRVGGVSVLISLLFIGVILFIIYKQLLSPLKCLQEGANEIKKGNFSHKIIISSKDELGNFADTFNEMTGRLKEIYGHLEEKIKDRTKDLDKAVKELSKKNKETEDRGRAMINLLEDSRLLEEQIKDEKDRLNAIIGSMVEGLVVTNEKGEITFINLAAEKILELSDKKFEGQNIDKIMPLYNSKECVTKISLVDRPIIKVMKTGKVVVSTLADNFYFKSKSGKKIAIVLAATPLLKDGSSIGAVSIFRDVSVEKQLDDAKTGFISIASHQLRTPLTSMRWFSEMLLSGDAGKINEDQKKFVDRIYQGIDRMISLVNLLLQIARVEAGRVKINPTPTDFKNIIRGVSLILKTSLGEKSQKIKIISKPENFPKILMDQEVVWQVFQNLLSNASRYAPANSEIVVSMIEKDDMAEFSVADKGIGIPEDVKDRIFEKFFRAENALKLVPEGSGLGLNLVKSLVDGWGGKTWFESEKDKGTTFYFTMPLIGAKAKEGEVGIAV